MDGGGGRRSTSRSAQAGEMAGGFFSSRSREERSPIQGAREVPHTARAQRARSRVIKRLCDANSRGLIESEWTRCELGYCSLGNRLPTRQLSRKRRGFVRQRLGEFQILFPNLVLGLPHEQLR